MNTDMTANPWDQRLARWLVRPLVNTPVTPNQITTLGLFAGIAAALMFAVGSPLWSNRAAVVFAFAQFVDHADGELARLSGKTSRFGQQFDRITSVITKTLLFVGIGYGLRDGVLGIWALSMGIVAGISIAVIFSVIGRIERHHGRAAASQPAFGGFEIEDILYGIIPVTWLGGLMPFLIAAVLGAPVFAAWMYCRYRRVSTAPGSSSPRQKG